MATVQTRLTLDRFLKLPEQKPYLEFLDGVVTQKRSGDATQGCLQVVIATWLGEACRATGAARVFIELHSHWPGRASLCPDVSVYRVERIPTTPDGYIAEDFWTPPDLAVEIAAPDELSWELTSRALTLIDLDVKTVMLVEPRQERIRLARPGQETVSFTGDDVVTVEDVLPGFSFVVRDLFAAL